VKEAFWYVNVCNINIFPYPLYREIHKKKFCFRKDYFIERRRERLRDIAKREFMEMERRGNIEKDVRN